MQNVNEDWRHLMADIQRACDLLTVSGISEAMHEEAQNRLLVFAQDNVGNEFPPLPSQLKDIGEKYVEFWVNLLRKEFTDDDTDKLLDLLTTPILVRFMRFLNEENTKKVGVFFKEEFDSFAAWCQDRVLASNEHPVSKPSLH